MTPVKTDLKNDTTFQEHVARSNTLGDVVNHIDLVAKEFWRIAPPYQRNERQNGMEDGFVIVRHILNNIIDLETTK